MNMLIDKLPKEVDINGKVYEIDSNFRTSILFEQLIQDTDIKDESKILYALNLYFHKEIQENDLEEAINKIFWFYSGGKDVIEENKKENKNNTREEERIYDFDYDDEYIYSAFLAQYNIDLQDINYLHWWKFKAMFKSLKENHKISEIMKYRSINLNDIKDEGERKLYKKMKEIYKLPRKVNKAEMERKNKIEDILMGDGILKNL